MTFWSRLRALAGQKGYRQGPIALVGFVVAYFIRSYLLLVMARIAPPGLSTACHRWRGVRMGADVYIDRFAVIDGSYPERITIEDEVRIAPGAVVVAHYEPGATLARVSAPYVKPVRLCRSSFIGVNAVIMPGVTVGECAIVMGGSVVLSDVAPYHVVCGNPARVVSRLKGVV